MRYQVVWDLVRAWIRKEGLRLEVDARIRFAATILTIHKRLGTRPFYFGEPCYKHKAANLICCVTIRRNLAVYYGVHKASRTVFISRLAWQANK